MNNEAVGTSPIKLPLPPMGYKVSFSLPDYATSTVFYQVEPKQNLTIKRLLKKDAIDFEADFDLSAKSVLQAFKNVPKASTIQFEFVIFFHAFFGRLFL